MSLWNYWSFKYVIRKTLHANCIDLLVIIKILFSNWTGEQFTKISEFQFFLSWLDLHIGKFIRLASRENALTPSLLIILLFQVSLSKQQRIASYQTATFHQFLEIQKLQVSFFLLPWTYLESEHIINILTKSYVVFCVLLNSKCTLVYINSM